VAKGPGPELSSTDLIAPLTDPAGGGHLPSGLAGF